MENNRQGRRFVTFSGPDSTFNENPARRRRSGGGVAGFIIFTAVGVLTLAGAVLLPEYAALVDIRAKRDVLAHHVRCEEKLTAYSDRMIRAVQDDPVLLARLMIRHGNYRPMGCETVKFDSAPPDRSVPQRILDEALNPPQPNENRHLVRAGLWVNDPATSVSLILLAMGILTAGVVLFRPTLPE